jgi:hypothetical protein
MMRDFVAWLFLAAMGVVIAVVSVSEAVPGTSLSVIRDLAAWQLVFDSSALVFLGRMLYRFVSRETR